jgi:hypothetical protein
MRRARTRVSETSMGWSDCGLRQSGHACSSAAAAWARQSVQNSCAHARGCNCARGSRQMPQVNVSALGTAEPIGSG